MKPLSDQILNFKEISDLMKVHGRFYEMSADQQKEFIDIENSYSADYQATNVTDPFLHHIFQSSLPSEVCFRADPVEKRLISTGAFTDLKKKGYKRRFIFEDHSLWTLFEHDKI